MNKFSGYLSELFDSGGAYSVDRASRTNFIDRLEHDSGSTVFAAQDNEDDGWHVVFWYENDRGKRTFAPTGAGRQYEVMGFVMKAFEEFMRRYHPPYIVFTADHDGNGDSRSRAYEAIGKRFAPRYGYSFDKIKRGTETEFAMVKK